MPKDYVRLLLELAGPFTPLEKPTPDDWRSLESELGLEFPPDYKALVSAFGAGNFGSGLELKNPRASAASMHISRGTLLAHREMMDGLIEEFGVPLYPDPRGLVLIGSLDRQDFLLRPDDKGRRLEQLVWWNLDTEEVSDLKTPISEFLYELHFGRVSHEWADELRQYVWRNGTVPFFTPWRPTHQR